MKLFKTVEDTRNHVLSLSNQQLTLGFVATMGALHDGHLALVQKAVRENDRVAVSIFVNPIQFNNPKDLEKYPRNLEADVQKLSPLLGGEDFIFAPSEAEMYPEAETSVYDFGYLAGVMEGHFRPGHFNGVGVVVNRLFRIIEPGKAYFGEKDFQQLAVIRRLTAIEKLPVRIIPCAIVREPDGLAMSSRNIRLSPQHREAAPLIYSTIREASQRLSTDGPVELRQFITSTLNAARLLTVEYVEFADEETLAPIADWADSDTIRCFIAVQAGEVRLIDNIHCSK